MSLKFKIRSSRYAPNKMFVVELDGKELVTTFLNDHDAPKLKAELEAMGLLEDAEEVEAEGS